MKLSWTEPWSRGRVRYRIREANKSMPSARKISILGGVLSLGAMLCVRWTLPESGEVLTLGRMLLIALLCSSYAWFAHFMALFPQCVHLSEKGVFLQCGNSGSLIRREQICSISFEDRHGLHLLVMRCGSKHGKEFERTAVASTKVPDSEVEKFLFDVGLAHLWKGEPREPNGSNLTGFEA